MSSDEVRNIKHSSTCRCWRCFALTMGDFINDLGKKTICGEWSLFLTLSYRTPTYPWAKHFPRRSEPHPDFVHHFADHMIRWLKQELNATVEYFCADQCGELGGRLHQHFGIASPALLRLKADLITLQKTGSKALPEELKSFQRMLWNRAGFNRILPWIHPASHYIGRYIGRDAARCYWEWNLKAESSQAHHYPVGRHVIALSQDLPACYYRDILRRRHR